MAKLLFGAAVAGAALAGTFVAPRTGTAAGEWYANLEKPFFTPPDWLFGPAWTTLYVLMAVSGYRMWRAAHTPSRDAGLRLWAGQLVLNAAWSPIFFGAGRPAVALADLALLFAAEVAYTRVAARTDRPAAWMFAPYLAWTAYAGALNFEIVRLNG